MEQVKELKVDHEHRGHAVLSASSAERWMHCTPSVRIAEGIPEKPSFYAEEGTNAHENAEKYIRKLLDGENEDTICKELFKEDEKELQENVQLYVHCVMKELERLKQKDSDAVLMPEVKISYDNVAKEGFGTSDCVIVGGDEIVIADLKYGKGIEVDAVNNPQLRLYGIGTLNRFMPLYEGLKTIKMMIIQPRLDHLSEETMTVEDLYAWGENVVKPLADLAYKGTGEFVEGKWCGFCKAKGCCPLLAKKNMSLQEDMENSKDVTALSEEEIAQCLEKGKGLVKWYKSLETYATDSALFGKQIPGFKLVEGRSKLVWSDEDEAKKGLRYAGLADNEIFEKKIITPAKALSILEDRVDDNTLQAIKDLSEKGNVNPTLVPIKDKREPLTQKAIDELMGNNDS